MCDTTTAVDLSIRLTTDTTLNQTRTQIDTPSLDRPRTIARGIRKVSFESPTSIEEVLRYTVQHLLGCN